MVNEGLTGTIQQAKNGHSKFFLSYSSISDDDIDQIKELFIELNKHNKVTELRQVDLTEVVPIYKCINHRHIGWMIIKLEIKEV